MAEISVCLSHSCTSAISAPLSSALITPIIFAERLFSEPEARADNRAPCVEGRDSALSAEEGGYGGYERFGLFIRNHVARLVEQGDLRMRRELLPFLGIYRRDQYITLAPDQ